MENTASIPWKRYRPALPWVMNVLFYGSVCWILVISELPPIQKPVFLMQKQFLAGNEQFFRIQDPGLPFAIFEHHLPRKGSVSFLTDTPHGSEHATGEQLLRAQGQLAPVLVNPDPVENIAFVFCSQNTAANVRMASTGYVPTRILGSGKIVAEKKS